MSPVRRIFGEKRASLPDLGVKRIATKGVSKKELNNFSRKRIFSKNEPLSPLFFAKGRALFRGMGGPIIGRNLRALMPCTCEWMITKSRRFSAAYWYSRFVSACGRRDPWT